MSTIRTGSAPAWDEALAADRPVVIEFKTDPERAAIAAAHHLEAGQGVHRNRCSRAIPNEGGVILGTAREVLASILPARIER